MYPCKPSSEVCILKVQPKYSHFKVKNYTKYPNMPLYTNKLIALAAVKAGK